MSESSAMAGSRLGRIWAIALNTFREAARILGRVLADGPGEPVTGERVLPGRATRVCFHE